VSVLPPPVSVVPPPVSVVPPPVSVPPLGSEVLGSEVLGSEVLGSEVGVELLPVSVGFEEPTQPYSRTSEKMNSRKFVEVDPKVPYLLLFVL